MWDVFFGRLIARGLIDVLPVALVSFYAIYKSNHPIKIKEPHESGRNNNENKEKDSSEQLTARTAEKRERIAQLLTQLVLLPAVLAAICTFIKGLASYHEFWDWPVLFLLFFFLLCIPILLREPYTKELIGNISTKKASYLLRTILPFSFYLRQFSTDKYHTYREDPDSFSEGVLANGLKHRLIRLFDLGHPAEIDSPIGGVRVYATSDWEKDVEKIIRRARHVYFRVSASENCRKEFEMTLIILGKITYIVDKPGLNDYEILRKEYPILPAIEPITGDYVYFINKGKNDSWLIAQYINTGTAYEPFDAKKRMHHSSDELNYCRDRALKFLGAIVIVLIIGFIMSDRKDKTSKQAWINQNVAEFPIRIDSTITIRNCVFDKNGLIISASVPSAAGSDIDDEELAVLCFLHLNQYDLGNVRECYHLISRNNGSLIITIDDAENNELSRLVYQQETDFERLWEMCLRINQRRDEIQKEAESNDPRARAKRMREQLKKSLSSLAY